MESSSEGSVAPRRWPLARLAFILALVVVPAILLGSGQLLISDFARGRAMREDVDESFRRRAQLQTVLSLLQDVETSQRGYLLTGNERFLEPYIVARKRLVGDLDRLDQLLESESGPGSSLRDLEILAARKLAFADRTIDLRRQGRAGEATQMVAAGTGRRLMDRMRLIIGDLDTVESDQLERRVRAMQQMSFDAQRLVIVLHVLLILMLAAAGLVVSRTFAARRTALARVNELGARQAAMLAGARDGVVMLDDDGTIESVNAAAAEMYDYSIEELRGRDVGLLFEMDLDGRHGDTFLSRRRPATNVSQGLVHELWGRRRHGSAFPIDVSISPIPLADGTRYLAIIRDVSDRKQMEQIKDEFVSTVSHELRTPLTSIAGSLGLIAGGAAGVLPDKAMRLIDIAKSNSERLVRLINDILDIEKIESGAIEFDIRPTLLKPVIAEAIEANRAFAASHGVPVALTACPDDACALVDADGLTQVITNLISNAAKFSPRGKRIEVSVSRDGDMHRLTVADRGAGIPEDFRSRIFEKFAQADSSDARRKGGTGLGLSIAREIVERLGGRIGFEDRDGGGTCFHVDLRAAEPQKVSRRYDPASGEAPPRILHVDDDPLIRRLVAKAFSHRAEMHYAPTIAAARAVLAEAEFDLAILDITLPDGSGLSLMPELHAAGRRTPVIVFSAKDLENPRASEADAIIPKSQATIDELVEAATLLIEAPRKAA